MALLLAGAACSLPFLVPLHEAPWPSFHAEWLAGALFCLAVLAALASRRLSNFPAVTGGLLLLIGVVAVQGISRGMVALPALTMGYLMLSLLVAWLGAQLSSAERLPEVVKVLAAFILGAAILNALAAVAQVYGIPPWARDWIAVLHGGRAYGNVAQPNLFANYAALGLLSLLYLHAACRMHFALLVLLGGLLLWASALSGSRAALAYPFMAAALAWIPARAGQSLAAMSLARRAILFAVLTMTAHALLPFLNDGFAFSRADTTFSRVNESSWSFRLAAWETAVRLFLAHPLAGVGPGQFAGAAFADGLPARIDDPMHVWTSAHNFVLQVAVEWGSVGLAALVLALWPMLRQMHRDSHRAFDLARWWVTGVLAIELLHALVEHPLSSAHFLALTALSLGLLVGGEPASRPGIFRRVGLLAAVSLVTFLLGWLWRDYTVLDETRATGAGITLAGPASADIVRLQAIASGPLAPLAKRALCEGLVPDKRALASKLALTEEVARFWPSPAVIVRRSAFLALGGQAAEGTRLMAKLPRSTDPLLMATVLDQAAREDGAAIAALGVYRGHQ